MAKNKAKKTQPKTDLLHAHATKAALKKLGASASRVRGTYLDKIATAQAAPKVEGRLGERKGVCVSCKAPDVNVAIYMVVGKPMALCVSCAPPGGNPVIDVLEMAKGAPTRSPEASKAFPPPKVTLAPERTTKAPVAPAKAPPVPSTTVVEAPKEKPKGIVTSDAPTFPDGTKPIPGQTFAWIVRDRGHLVGAREYRAQPTDAVRIKFIGFNSGSFMFDDGTRDGKDLVWIDIPKEDAAIHIYPDTDAGERRATTEATAQNKQWEAYFAALDAAKPKKAKRTARKAA